MALAPEQKLTYPLGGPSAQAAFEGGVQGFEAKSFRGLGVFTSTPVRHDTTRFKRPCALSSIVSVDSVAN